MTTSAWIATVDTPTGTFAFLFVNQDFTLASSNGFVVDTGTENGWYLSEFKNINTLSVDGADLDFTDAMLLINEPETNQAVTTTETTSVSVSLSGTAGVDSSGGSASTSAGISWSTSNTFSMANVDINNKSLAERTDLGNDASWQYLPRKSSGLDDSCENSIHDLADLAHNTFTPSQGYYYQIDGSFADQTLSLNTVISTSFTNTYVGDCNVFGCNCDINQNTKIPDSGQGSFTQAIHIPAAP